jgi:hypothetical protein
MAMRDEEAGERAFSPVYRGILACQIGWMCTENIYKNRKPKMKTTVWFEKIRPTLKQVFRMVFFYSVVRYL